MAEQLELIPNEEKEILELNNRIKNTIIERQPFVTKNSILGFFGIYRCLSNFHMCRVLFEGRKFTSSEAAFMSAKTLEPSVKDLFVELSPNKAKALGRNIALQPNWDEIRVSVMEQILLDKFTRNLELKNILLQTGNKYLSEHNNWGDSFWGFDVVKNKGENNLGKVLMKTRESIILNGK